MDSPKCLHKEFEAFVDVGRLSAGEGGPVTHYNADVRINCKQCGEAFVFIGMDKGFSPTEPRISVLGDEARLPIRPQSEAMDRLPAIPGFRMKTRQGN